MAAFRVIDNEADWCFVVVVGGGGFPLIVDGAFFIVIGKGAERMASCGGVVGLVGLAGELSGTDGWVMGIWVVPLTQRAQRSQWWRTGWKTFDRGMVIVVIGVESRL